MANFFSNLFRKNSKLETNQLIVKKTIISFTFFFLFAGAALWGWYWLRHQPLDGGIRGGIPQPLRAGLDKNEKIFSGLLSDKHLAREYPRSSAVKKARVNGNVGMGNDFDAATWQMYVIRSNGDSLKLKLDDLKKLPKTEVVFNFKCIEGWSQITWWGGVKFSDFMKAYGLTAEAGKNYLGLSTPDEEYYVGIDMASAMHPQTILCYELNGAPLPMNQGYPLRLIIPTKYGVKHLKRIGTMYFDDARPPDYWAERGYDYFTGL
ncbi:MAG TPA: molybdopterin-dependent oxidoreductase [Chitinophagaceae bacterium]|nr:molybdopterin-dependent oxidoreductase [Chitinophagaceae bacterium]